MCWPQFYTQVLREDVRKKWQNQCETNNSRSGVLRLPCAASLSLSLSMKSLLLLKKGREGSLTMAAAASFDFAMRTGSPVH